MRISGHAGGRTRRAPPGPQISARPERDGSGAAADRAPPIRDFGDSWQLSSFLNVLSGMGHPERVRPWTGPERLFIGITIVGVMFLCAAFAMWVVGG